jgi:hypothetical protein
MHEKIGRKYRKDGRRGKRLRDLEGGEGREVDLSWMIDRLDRKRQHSERRALRPSVRNKNEE